jgi:hypothetical protein
MPVIGGDDASKLALVMVRIAAGDHPTDKQLDDLGFVSGAARQAASALAGRALCPASVTGNPVDCGGCEEHFAPTPTHRCIGAGARRDGTADDCRDCERAAEAALNAAKKESQR